ncbi:hypothetical protein I5Q34_01480 [Streptomyces sp. AV19]|uniref:hypothetical protein n=1 Tax=Streptomyces sp. AV19 TaxID=2793068 RepID=UPI0018FE049C|nr:hypothetical protein [Streptomyces sp. AV19]MBH1932974.1 hypothetical protein [Streptomyces sp. AV19]MDG4533855.1 hypothetical protein [Streptomyces sp. AV19]
MNRVGEATALAADPHRPAAPAAVTARAERSAAGELLALADRAEDPLARALLLDPHRLFTLRRLGVHGGNR